jgi:hypothetical protein
VKFDSHQTITCGICKSAINTAKASEWPLRREKAWGVNPQAFLVILMNRILPSIDRLLKIEKQIFAS